MRKFGLSLKIPLSDYVHSEGAASVVIPYLKPYDILERVLLKQPWMVLGGSTGEESERLLLAFWDDYRVEHPGHAVFQFSRDRLRRTIPFTIHGDGGRTQKKQPLEIFSMQPVIGLNTALGKKTHCRCDTSVAVGGDDMGCPASQCLNTKYSTYLTHFLIFAYPSKSYFKDFPQLLNGLLETACSNLGNVCCGGVVGFDGQRWFPAVVGFKLDMEWMAKCGSLTRSYQNVGHVREIPCCHECDAGMAGVPFENVNPNAEWMATRFSTVPWNTPPPWKDIPFDVAQPARFLRRDAFHIFRLGIGRNYIASCIYLFCYMDCPLDSQWVHAHFVFN